MAVDTWNAFCSLYVRTGQPSAAAAAAAAAHAPIAISAAEAPCTTEHFFIFFQRPNNTRFPPALVAPPPLLRFPIRKRQTTRLSTRLLRCKAFAAAALRWRDMRRQSLPAERQGAVGDCATFVFFLIFKRA